MTSPAVEQYAGHVASPLNALFDVQEWRSKAKAAGMSSEMFDDLLADGRLYAVDDDLIVESRRAVIRTQREQIGIGGRVSQVDVDPFVAYEIRRYRMSPAAVRALADDAAETRKAKLDLPRVIAEADRRKAHEAAEISRRDVWKQAESERADRFASMGPVERAAYTLIERGKLSPELAAFAKALALGIESERDAMNERAQRGPRGPEAMPAHVRRVLGEPLTFEPKPFEEGK